jgi:hypothetical protein
LPVIRVETMIKAPLGLLGALAARLFLTWYPLTARATYLKQYAERVEVRHFE